MEFHLIPKVELHLHLDCSLSFSVVSKIEPSITLARYRQDFIAPAKCPNLRDYLTRAIHGIALMQTEQALRFVVDDLFTQLVADNVLYAEIRFAPHLHMEKDLTAEQVVEIVDSAVTQGCERTGIEARLILCTLRHFSAAQSMETVQLAERFQGRRVVALDIAGDEAGYLLDAHIPAFSYAIANNISRTAHAGEARGADSVWETLQHLRPTRIGHGVRSIEDARLVNRLKADNIHLEICPTSNVQTNVVRTHDEHPVNRLYASGISLGINTDARAISDVTLNSEYQLLNKTFGWREEHFRLCNSNALRSAFVPDEVKAKLRSRLEDEYHALL